jgi:hypothetical protein
MEGGDYSGARKGYYLGITRMKSSKTAISA